MRELLSLAPRPGRYLGIEEGAVRLERNAGQGALRCALAFPDLYEVGMSYLGQKILYNLLNARPGTIAERVFAPCRETAALLRERNVPLATLESDTPLAEMDLIGFSITHELCYTNVLYMLDLGGIPLRAEDRARSGQTWPLILAGGGCTLAAEPLAPFVDAMLLGEGEEALPEVTDLLAEARAQGLDRPAVLRRLARIPGIYVPELFAPGDRGELVPLEPDLPRPTRRVVADMDDAPYPSRQVVPLGAVHNRLSLEVARGCTRGCRFCQAGMIYRPARERSLPELAQLLDQCLRDTGFDEVSFLSLSTGDFSGLRGLFLDAAERCGREQISLALPSLRVGSIDDAIMERMAGIRRTGATLAPEAGSQRLRDSINKGISEEQVLRHVRRLAAHGWQQVKLYFMIGLPGETDEDLEAIIDLCRKVRDAAKAEQRHMPRLQVTASVSPFVPKAHTPFQWEAQISQQEIQRRVNLLRDMVRGERSLKLRWHEPGMSFLEGLLSRGDRRLADVIEQAYRQGAIFASWMEGFSLDPWLQALADAGLRAEEYTGARDPERPLPWSHLESGVSRRFLLAELERSRTGSLTPDCRYDACRQCGVCDTAAGPAQVTGGHGQPIANRLNFAARDQQEQSTGLPQPVEPPQDALADKPQARTGKKIPEGTSPELAVKAVRYRVWHAKKGQAAFISQLELQPLLERAMRRAGLPLAFSQGFHPLPLISFGRALPVGVESEAEWFSVTLREAWSAGALLRALGGCMLPGMDLLRADAVAVNEKTFGAPRERFAVSLTDAGSGSEAEAFAAQWLDFAAASSLPFLHETKKGTREIDLRALLAGCTPRAGAAAVMDIVLDWSVSYLSPLTFVRAVTPDIRPERLRIVKLEQMFS